MNGWTRPLPCPSSPVSPWQHSTREDERRVEQSVKVLWKKDRETGRKKSTKLLSVLFCRADASSSSAPLFCGVPKDLFALSFISCFHWQIMHRQNTDFHCYMDDTWLYVLTPGIPDASCITSCLAEIKNWMSKIFLQLNEYKWDIMITMRYNGNYPTLVAIISPLSWVP